MDIWYFLSAAVLITLMPGPDILFVVTQSITQGRKAGIIFALGLCTGLLFHIAAVSLGVSVLIKESPTAFTVLKICGAAYLFYIAVKTFIHRRNSLDLDQQSKGAHRLYLRGIVMNITNPKVILFFLAFLPQFVNVDAEKPALKMCVLGLVFIVQALVVFSIVALLASRLSERLMGNSRSALWMNTIASAVYLLVGISVILI